MAALARRDCARPLPCGHDYESFQDRCRRAVHVVAKLLEPAGHVHGLIFKDGVEIPASAAQR
jgi:hypothetical protein